MRVLLVDDDDLSREVLGILLSEEGHEVVAASSGEEALEELRAGSAARPEAVLTDWQMPGMCGPELVRRLREVSGAPVRVLGMSGSQPPTEEVAACDAFLLKPFGMEEFREAAGPPRGEADLSVAGERERGEWISQGGAEVLDGTVLDGTVLERFRSMLGEAPLRELYQACLRDVVSGSQTMEAAEQAGDYEQLRKVAHALKGSLGMLGARELERMCVDLEAPVVNATYVTRLQQFPLGIQRLRDMLNALGVADQQ